MENAAFEEDDMEELKLELSISSEEEEETSAKEGDDDVAPREHKWREKANPHSPVAGRPRRGIPPASVP
jgi:hypothetical protein